MYAIDLLGYGYSDKPTPRPDAPNSIYNFENWGAQLCDFRKEVVKSPAFLVSNSVGGIASLQAAVSSSDVFLGVCLMNVSLRGLHLKKQPELLKPLLARFQALLRTSPLGPAFFANVARFSAVKSVLREAYGNKEAVTDELVESILQPGLQPGASRVFLDFLSYSTGPLAEELLQVVSCPVLTLWGQADPWESVALARELYSPKAAPAVQRFVELPGVGHCPMNEAPAVVNALVAEWCAEVLEKRRGAAEPLLA